MPDKEKEPISLNALVIDDSRVMRSMVMRSLDMSKVARFYYTEAENGSDALDKFDADKIDIIFVDWNMPGMNGLEFARQIRSMHWANHVPVVMITSEAGADKQEDAYEKARITCYIPKPFTVEELQHKIGPVVDGIKEKRHRSSTSAPMPKQSSGFFTRLLS